ncbi:hypothetical protein ACSBR1_002303 [Camellia fascicularis]
MTTTGNRWGVVMSRNSGYSEQVWLSDQVVTNVTCVELADILMFWTDLYQVVELHFLYPSEGIHRRWENGFRITSMAATVDQAAFILSVPKRKMMDETQETLRTSDFPSTHVKEKWAKNLYIASICYGRTVC